MNPFTDPRLRPATLDTAPVRGAILAALDAAIPRLSGELLDVGCGRMPYRERILAAGKVTRYVGLDLPGNPHAVPDLTWDGAHVPLPDASMDAALLTEVLEHCADPAAVLGEVARVLRPGATLAFTVPFVWPLHEVPHDEHRYTPFALQRLLEGAGFGSVEIRALGGWDLTLASLLALWVKRRLPSPLRLPAAFAAWPVVAALRALDRPPTQFTESTMVLGLSGTAVRLHRERGPE